MKRCKIETSKKLLIFSDTMAAIVTFTVLIGWFKGLDLTGTEVIIGGIYAWVASAHGFYYNKAKFENGIKLRRENPEHYDSVAQQTGGIEL